MSTSTIVLIAIPALIILAGAVAFTSLKRRDSKGLGHLSRETRQRDAATASVSSGSSQARDLERSVALERAGGEVVVPEPKAPVVWTPPDPEEIGVNRRQFLNRSAITLMGVGLSTFGAANIAFLWPRPSSGFGSKIKIGKTSVVDAVLAAGPDVNFAYFSEAQSYVQAYPAESLDAAREIYTNGRIIAGMEQGYIALWQKCPHLGCKVPACASSQWFEYPFHGSKYNRVGEKKAGPAPRGMDRFPVEIDAEGNLVVDTGAPSNGPSIGVDTTGQGLEGPHC
jgi:cytochrome b6-f complex iron-sulfur subunit